MPFFCGFNSVPYDSVLVLRPHTGTLSQWTYLHLVIYRPEIDDAAPLLQRVRGMLSASAPLPDRLLLSQESRTPAMQRAHALFEAVFSGALAFIPVLTIAAVFRALGVERGPLAAIAAAIVLGVAMHIFIKEMCDRTWAWDQTKWLDFTDRVWRSNKRFAHDSMSVEASSIPFASLVLVYHYASMQEGIHFHLELGQFSDLGQYFSVPSECTQQVFYSDNEQEVLNFALQLAERWGIDCWYYAAPSDGGLQRKFSPSGQG